MNVIRTIYMIPLIVTSLRDITNINQLALVGNVNEMAKAYDDF